MPRLTPEQAASLGLCRYCRTEMTPDTYCERCAREIERVCGPGFRAAVAAGAVVQTPVAELIRTGAVCGTCADEGERSCSCWDRVTR